MVPLILLLISVVSSQVVPPPDYTTQLNVVYVTVGDWQGIMDLYLPPGDNNTLAIHVHGGAFVIGSRADDTDFRPFFNLRYAVANIDYRLAGTAPAPAAIIDVRSALIYAMTNAKILRINPKRIVMSGTSAGGFLALVAGLLGNRRTFDNPNNLTWIKNELNFYQK